jgi:hypothetical protein
MILAQANEKPSSMVIGWVKRIGPGKGIVWLNSITTGGDMFNSRFICLMIFLSFFSAMAYADNIDLIWDAKEGADYYVVYWSTDPANYSEENSYEVSADVTLLQLVDSPNGEEYYYSVRAFNDCGSSSDFSEPVMTAHFPLALYSQAPEKTSAASSVASGSSGSGGGGGCFIESAM